LGKEVFVLKKLLIFFLVLFLLSFLSPEIMAQNFSVQGNVSYWAGQVWIGATARAHLTDNFTARASLGVAMQRYIRASFDGIYNFKLTEEFDPFVGAGVSYSTFVGPSIDLLGGVNFRVEGFRLNAEATYSIFFAVPAEEPRPNPLGIRVGMSFSL